jgi:glycosyltransferase involved in cell wall biosynthesis
VTSGRLVFDKGFDAVLDSFSRVATLLPDWDIAIIGDGPAAASLKEKAIALGLAPRVHFYGFVDNAHEIYEKSDIFVYASPCEGFGMVIAEAQASGLPVVCYDCLAGPRDIVTDGVDGFLIKLGDAEGFARALYSLASDHCTREIMATAARLGRRRFEDAALMPKWGNVFTKK